MAERQYDQQQRTDHDLLQIRRGIDHIQTVGNDRNDRHAQHRAANRTNASQRTDTAKDRCGNGFQQQAIRDICAEDIFEANTKDATNAIAALNIYVMNRFLRRLIPLKRATSTLEPIR